MQIEIIDAASLTNSEATDERHTSRRQSAQKTRAERKIRARVRDDLYLRNGRTLHLVDIENLIGSSFATITMIKTVWSFYKKHAGIHDDDTVFIGCSRFMGKRALLAIDDNVRFLLRDKENGGENALMDLADPLWAARRFEWVVIASGDHAFVPWVEEAHTRGLKTWLVSGVSSVSVELRSTCQLHTRMRLPKTMPWLIPAYSTPSPLVFMGRRKPTELNPRARQQVGKPQNRLALTNVPV